jgi:uncharacterized repeat protein (TIGR03803 family)
LVGAFAVMSIVMLSGEELKHVPPAAPSFVVLHSFAGPPTDGANPLASLLRDAAGNLYGTTYFGGASKAGVVFKLSPTGAETVLYSFTGGADGANPTAGLFRDAAGNLYGTTEYGGADGAGVVFELVRCNSGYDFKVLHRFTGGGDGGLPLAGLIQDQAANLYGTTANGGAASKECPAGCGTIFKLSPTGTETVLHKFSGGDGASPGPGVGLIRDAEGNLYGTTEIGGAPSIVCNGGCGTVFKLSPTGTETILYGFTGGADGATPYAGLIQDAAGNLYGTTYVGGSSGPGVVFKLSPTGTETVLHSFTDGADGGLPSAGLVQDAAGNLYGTTGQGGATTCHPRYGCGVVFRLAP